MKIVATSRSPQHGFSKEPQPEVRLIRGEGVEGDAHRGATLQHLYLKRRDASAPNLCQVHLFAEEMLAELTTHGFAIKPGELGENLLTSGIDLLALPQGTRLRFGESGEDDAMVEVTGLRTPCLQIDSFRHGLQQHLWGAPAAGSDRKTRRAGVMAIVLRGGIVRPGDNVRIELPPEPHQPLGPV